MNQILKSNINNNVDDDEIKTKKNDHLNVLKVIFFISLGTAIIFFIIFLLKVYKIDKNTQISKRLISDYQVTTLYSSNITNYNANAIYNNNNNSDSFVIGMIKIDKIKLTYPILSKTSKELLDISVCRFAGPMPNQIGNLCIAGHNYVDYRFFNRLNELNKNDIIKIYDLNGLEVDYYITNIFEVKSTDLSCTNQNTNNKTMITLLTCNNVSGNRLVVTGESK